MQTFQVVLEGELFSICDGLSDASRIGQLLRAEVYLDITDDVCSLIIPCVAGNFGEHYI